MFVLVLLSLKKKETNQILRFVTCIVIPIIQIALAFFFFLKNVKNIDNISILLVVALEFWIKCVIFTV